jgi:hypothetical protein
MFIVALTFAIFAVPANGIHVEDQKNALLSKVWEELNQLDDAGLARVSRVLEDLKTNGSTGCSDVLVECPEHASGPVLIRRSTQSMYSAWKDKAESYFGWAKTEAGNVNDIYAVVGELVSNVVSDGLSLGLPGFNLASTALVWIVDEAYAQMVPCGEVSFQFCGPRLEPGKPARGPPPMQLDLGAMWYTASLANALFDSEKNPGSSRGSTVEQTVSAKLNQARGLSYQEVIQGRMSPAFYGLSACSNLPKLTFMMNIDNANDYRYYQACFHRVCGLMDRNYFYNTYSRNQNPMEITMGQIPYPESQASYERNDGIPFRAYPNAYCA